MTLFALYTVCFVIPLLVTGPLLGYDEPHDHHETSYGGIRIAVQMTERMMLQDKIGLEKLSETEEDGEKFWIIYISAEKLASHNGYMTETSQPLTEAEARDFFEKGNQPASDVEAMFRLARQAARSSSWKKRKYRKNRRFYTLSLAIAHGSRNPAAKVCDCDQKRNSCTERPRIPPCSTVKRREGIAIAIDSGRPAGDR